MRKSTLSDIPDLQHIFAEAKLKMRAAGNLYQWEDGYPSDEELAFDIRQGNSYVLTEDDHPVATFTLIPGIEPTYHTIYQGKWLDNDAPYVTLHRIASLQGVHGVFPAAMEVAATLSKNVRVDTHRDNYPMQHLMEKYGFTYCGIILLDNGDERLAYQRILP